jgi:Putative zinc-finger
MSLMWFLNCEEISRKVSDALDRRLPWYERAGIRFHFLMCKHCSHFEEHLTLLRNICRFEPQDGEKDPCDVLPEATKQHLKKLLKKA